MKFTHITRKISSLPSLAVSKVVSGNSLETYRLMQGNSVVCRFDFTNYRGCGRFYSHAEVKNFQVNKNFQRKLLGVKAILQARDIINKTAKEKNIKFVMFPFKGIVKENIRKLLKHLGVLEYCVDNLTQSCFLYLTEPKFYKRIKSRLYHPVEIKHCVLNHIVPFVK